MTKNEIVEILARERRVETMLANIAKQPVAGTLEDLCQMVYLVLLEYDEAKIADLWENGQINFFIARILLNQYRSSNSPYYKLFRKYMKHCFVMLSDAERLRSFQERVDVARYFRSEE